MVFGDPETAHFLGHELTPENINRFRTALEMQHWVTATAYGLRGRNYPNQYLEVKYENVCCHPIVEFTRIFDFLEVPFLDSTKNWLLGNVKQNRIGKWKALSPEEMELPIEIGGKLLGELGYT